MTKQTKHPFKDILEAEYTLGIDLVQHRMYGIIFAKNGIRTGALKKYVKETLKIGNDTLDDSIDRLKQKQLIIRRSEKVNNKLPTVITNYPNDQAKYYKIYKRFKKWKDDRNIDDNAEYRTSYNLVWCYHHLIQALKLLNSNDPDFEQEKNVIGTLLRALKNWDTQIQTKSIEQLNRDMTRLKNFHLGKIE